MRVAEKMNKLEFTKMVLPKYYSSLDVISGLETSIMPFPGNKVL